MAIKPTVAAFAKVAGAVKAAGSTNVGAAGAAMTTAATAAMSGSKQDSKETHVLFHASGLTSNQWRKLKNLWFPGRTVFHPSCRKTAKKKGFSAQLPHSAGPTCVLYLPEEASDKLELLPSRDSKDQQDLLLLYGQYQATLVDHVDIEKASDFDELETSLFNFYLPSSYLSFVCSREE